MAEAREEKRWYYPAPPPVDVRHWIGDIFRCLICGREIIVSIWVAIPKSLRCSCETGFIILPRWTNRVGRAYVPLPEKTPYERVVDRIER